MSRQAVTVVKIGGNVVDNPEALREFAARFAAMPGLKVLVHGGGKEATRLSARLDIPTTMIDGRRVTSAQTLDVCVMVYAGLVNKRVVALLQSLGCDAAGLSGADGNAICANMRPKQPVDYGFVGDIAEVNTGFIASLLESGKVPVFCAIAHDGAGTLLNCNADSVASALAVALAGSYDVELVYCFEQLGVMLDIERPDSVIPNITPELFEQLKRQGVVSKGMIPKIHNALEAVKAGVKSVAIKHADNLNAETGTRITL